MGMMDLTIRDWMVIIGVLLITAVLLDAWRRVRRDRYSQVRLKLAEPEEEAREVHEDIDWLKELPNGGARVVERGDLLRAAGHHAEEVAAEQSDAAHEPVVEQPPVEGVEEGEPLLAGINASGDGEPENVDWLDGLGSDSGAVAPSAADEPGRLPRDIDPEVFMLNVVARDSRGFRGEDILHILLACDLRFGDMSFFHRHEFEAGRGAIQFSVANMMQPGIFHIDNMSDFNTPGLVFFLTLPGPEDMMKAFDYMLETAQAVARNLEGDVLDESRSVLTRQTLEHCRQQIRDLERRMLAKAD
jgi:cell division protein ZipA